MNQTLRDVELEPGREHRESMDGLGAGICSVIFIIACVLWLALRKKAPWGLRAQAAPSGEIIEGEAVEVVSSTALVQQKGEHLVNASGYKVCRICSTAYSPNWYRPRMLFLVEGAAHTLGGMEARIRAYYRTPPAWRIEELEDEAQDICAQHHLLESQELAQEMEGYHQMYEQTTVEVTQRNQRFRESFHDRLAEKAGRRTWRSTADTF